MREEEVKSMLPLLPLAIRSSTLFWPSAVVEALTCLSRGPHISNVDSGETLFRAISDIRSFLSLSSHPLPPFTQLGFALFFDELIPRAEATKWFGEVVPALAHLLCRLPSLLETHYQNAHHLLGNGLNTALRLLPTQQPGIVFLSQELIGALLACAFFCLFPVSDRAAKDLPLINFDQLFQTLYESYSQKQENKIKCIIHYFERICSCTPVGFVSFERKVLSVEQLPSHVPYPQADLWSKSTVPLCSFKVCSSGFIEDQSTEALEVDFANKYLGGGALRRGCVQEEIRFMINPELIAGMLFLPSMEDNEAIEIVGAERFSNYTGYASSFHFAGDHVDKRNFDNFRRRKTRIVAIDALCSPGMKQYKLKYLLRETNKAFCGFLGHSKCGLYQRLFQDGGYQGAHQQQDDQDTNIISRINFLLDQAPSVSCEEERNEEESMSQAAGNTDQKACCCLYHEDNIGIATGNWGCGAFGGDPELKTIIQWLAASQALRPCILYYTFGIKALQDLEQVSQWILAHKWTVGDLWNMLVEYSSWRLKAKTDVGFFSWLLPSLTAHEPNWLRVTNGP